MGKKSRKPNRKHKPKGGGTALPTPASRAPVCDARSPPPGAVCWICLDGDPDEGGKPIVRDCACRGDDAGFAHFSCLVSYAETKTKGLIEEERDGSLGIPIEPWQKCPTCRQEYQRRLGIDMAKHYMAFLEENYSDYPDMKMRKLDGFNHMLSIMMNMDSNAIYAMREECKRAANKMISEIEGLDEATKQRHREIDIIGAHKTFAILALGRFADDGTKEGYELSAQCQEMVKNWFISQGDDTNARTVESHIKMNEARQDGKIDSSSTEILLVNTRETYEKATGKYGKDSVQSVHTGLNLAKLLMPTGRGLELERLLNDLKAVSRRVLGPDHTITKEIEIGLERARRRVVGVTTKEGVSEYTALRFDSGTGKYDVEGHFPVNGIYKFSIEVFEMAPGTPVICQGLKDTKHLNGKIGDVTRYDSAANCYEVRFEEEGLKPASVKEANLQILFKLPDKQ